MKQNNIDVIIVDIMTFVNYRPNDFLILKILVLSFFCSLTDHSFFERQFHEKIILFDDGCGAGACICQRLTR